jgi:hypothetical protein
MPRRPDGRIEPGQKLASAISARAWNRAQDAADIVLGERTEFGAEAGMRMPGQLVVPCLVTNNDLQGAIVQIGSIVDFRQPSSTSATIVGGNVTVRALAGVPFVPANLVDRRSQAAKGFGVILGGAKMPAFGESSVLDVCIAGPCIARVNRRSSSMLTRVQPPVIRNNLEAQFPKDIVGVGEDSECGHALLLQWLDVFTQVDIVYRAVILL